MEPPVLGERTFGGRCKAAFTIYYGLAPWILGVIIVLAAWLALITRQWACLAAELTLILAPYTFLGQQRPGLRKWFMHSASPAPLFAAESSFTIEEPIDKDAPVLLCYHPHGIFCGAVCGNFGVLHPGLAALRVRFCLAPFLYHMPIFRLLMIAWLGCFASASRTSFRREMKSKQHLALLPGGMEESTLSAVGTHRVYVRRRQGFIAMALRFGYCIRPIYTFGETDLYNNLVPEWLPLSLRLKLNSLGVPAVLPCGRWWAPLLPRQGVSVHTVVGRPIMCPLTPEPDTALVNDFHARYIEELTRLFETHKARLGHGSAQLEVY